MLLLYAAYQWAGCVTITERSIDRDALAQDDTTLGLMMDRRGRVSRPNFFSNLPVVSFRASAHTGVGIRPPVSLRAAGWRRGNLKGEVYPFRLQKDIKKAPPVSLRAAGWRRGNLKGEVYSFRLPKDI